MADYDDIPAIAVDIGNGITFNIKATTFNHKLLRHGDTDEGVNFEISATTTDGPVTVDEATRNNIKSGIYNKQSDLVKALSQTVLQTAMDIDDGDSNDVTVGGLEDLREHLVEKINEGGENAAVYALTLKSLYDPDTQDLLRKGKKSSLLAGDIEDKTESNNDRLDWSEMKEFNGAHSAGDLALANQTLAALNVKAPDATATTPTTETTPATTGSYEKTNDLVAKGSSGYLRVGSNLDATDLKTRLKDLGYAVDATNGTYDKATKAKVEELQVKYGILKDGVVGPDTLAVLQLEEAKKGLLDLNKDNADEKIMVAGVETTRKEYAVKQVEAAEKAFSGSFNTERNSDKMREAFASLGEELTKDKKEVFANNAPKLDDLSLKITPT